MHVLQIYIQSSLECNFCLDTNRDEETTGRIEASSNMRQDNFFQKRMLANDSYL